MSGVSPWLTQRLISSCQARPILIRIPKSELSILVSRTRRTSLRSFSLATKKLQSTDSSKIILGTATPDWRAQELLKYGFNAYPRTDGSPKSTIAEFKKQWLNQISAGQTDRTSTPATVVGRISSVRTAGSKLVFIDLLDHSDNEKLQVVINKSQLDNIDPSTNRVKQLGKLVQRGDVISVTGYPHCTAANEFSILATQIPQLVAPCLHQFPTTSFGDNSSLARERHVEMLTDPSRIRTIVARSTITSSIATFMNEHHFVNVQTPILAASAGGAIARSFETTATEFPDRKIALRVAPELWLKRLIVGGLQRVYELGPSFRNEGLDKTHNPEFTTCEFYATNWSLKELQRFTKRLIERAAANVVGLDAEFQQSIGSSEAERWPEIDFIPALNAALQLELPDLSQPQAREKIVRIFDEKNIHLPSQPTLPRLLDKLCSIYLEPGCHQATWIINTPECLSPLAKSYVHPDLPNQRVAARAELFIHNKEVVNCYEEENSPVEQRRKFVDQQTQAQLRDDGHDSTGSRVSVDEEAMKVDEEYLRALEWGLPPTGGWGCGIDRLVMLMLGKSKISEVLSFGSLRMVTHGAEKEESAEAK